jgi:hypothetical protein
MDFLASIASIDVLGVSSVNRPVLRVLQAFGW